MLKVGVLGAGHLGKIHLKLLNQSNKYTLIGFFDPSDENTKKVSKEYGQVALFELLPHFLPDPTICEPAAHFARLDA